MPKEGVRSPTSHRTPAQMREKARGYNARPENVKKRVLNNQARAMMRKKHGESAIAGKDVDHKRPLRSGGGNSAGNLRLMDPAKNRGWNKK